MKPNSKWIDDWRIGEEPSRESQIANALLEVFVDFWDSNALGDKSKTTMNRYSVALHALGGYLVEQSISEGGLDKTIDELLSEYVGPYDGPLICHDNEVWQEEIDMVCRKLHKHLKRKC